MTAADLPPLALTKWWRIFTDAQHRDPMSALYDAEQEFYAASKAVVDAQKDKAEWQSRIDELRKLIHTRIGPKP